MLERLFGVRSILVLSLLLSTAVSAQNTVSFNHISPSINNKQVRVSSTIQDKWGNILMVCNEGILKYDGYDYYLTKNENIFRNLKPIDGIENIVKVNENTSWIRTKFGLISELNHNTGIYSNLSDSKLQNILILKMYFKNNIGWLISSTGKLYQFSNNKLEFIATLKDNKTTIDNINDLVVNDLNNQIFLGTKNGKVFNYNVEKRQLTEIIGPFTNYPGVIVLTIDNFKRLWIGTETHGLFVYDLLKKEYVQNNIFKDNIHDIQQGLFLNLFKDSYGNIWAGTDGNGLFMINPITGKTTIYTKQEKNSFSLSSNTIININEDNNKNLWVVTNYGNTNIIAHNNSNIKYLSGSESDKPLRILSMYKTQDKLWIGTDGWGITKVDYNKDGTITRKQFFAKEGQDKGFYVQSITADNKGNIWFGTYKNGLWIYDINKNSFSNLPIFNSQNHKATDVRTVFTDSQNRIWVSSNVSLNIYNTNKQLLASFVKKSNGLDETIVESIIEDKDHKIWLGVLNSSLNNFNENKQNIQYSNFEKNPYGDKSIAGIKSMALGEKNDIVLITDNGNLLNFNTKTKKYFDYNAYINHSEQSFHGVLVDNQMKIWLSSNNGIYNFNPKTKELKTYHITDGLQDNYFMPRSVLKDNEGLLYFGGLKGLNYFSPTKIAKTKVDAQLLIQQIEILNQPIDSLAQFKNNKRPANLNFINLKNKQSSFSFKFSAVGNIVNPYYYYAYRLKGFDKTWIVNHSERIATYTNIPPGNYTFEVKAGTKAGVWDIPINSIEISIDQPWWFSMPAFLAYLLLLGVIIYFLKRWYNLKKGMFLQKVVYRKEKEVHKSKMAFFTKMSHEIQTPLTLILSPISDMIKSAGESGNLLLEDQLQIISNNAKRLSKIARHLTLLRDKEADKLKLTVSENNLPAHIINIKLSFSELARQKNIDFDMNVSNGISKAWYDKEKLEHVIYNFLSNAFKFTPKEGEIFIRVEPSDDNSKMEISVKNSGSLIPAKELEKIFKLFYQASKSVGTGIGLALSKELIILHKGEIKVKSDKSNGTVFTAIIPYFEDSYTEDEKSTIQENEDLPSFISKTSDALVELDSSAKTILIVEDNYELQNFLKGSLNKQYNVLVADNGDLGYKKAKEHMPDLIISDVMMPILDGIEMCKKLQNNKATNHIPVILLTAKYSTNSKIAGLESGAIEYLYKPFNTQELILRVNNILVNKEHIITEYRKEIINNPNVPNQKSEDEKFIEELVAIINSKSVDSNLKVEDIADELNMSYSTLYRKCLSITGKSVLDFITELRLKKAAILLIKYKHTISDTAFLSGFNDPKYFAKCFKKQFGKTPAEFKKEAKLDLD